MRIGHTVSDGILFLRLQGELDQHMAAIIRKKMAGYLMSQSVREIRLDLFELTFMDSSGIGLLIHWYKAVLQRGGSVRLCNVQPCVARILRMSGLQQIVEIGEVGRVC